MSTWVVENRATGEIVHAYDAEGAVEWAEYPFAEFNHQQQIVLSTVHAPLERNISGVQYLRRFTQAERISIREAAKASPELDDYLRLLDTTIAQGGVVNLNDSDVIQAVTLLEFLGLIVAGRAAEILT